MRTISTQTLFIMAGFHTLVALFPAAVLVLWLRPRLWLHMLALFLGVLTGLLSVRGDDPQFPVLLLLVFGFFAGFAHPRRAWVLAALLAVWIPVALVAALLAGVVRGRPWGVPSACLAFVPALIGAYIGVFVCRASGFAAEMKGDAPDAGSERTLPDKRPWP